MLLCPKCNYDNELGRIFCHSCGTKLDLSKIKAPTEAAKMRRRMKKTATKSVRSAVELVIACGIIALIALICLAPEVPVFKADTGQLDAAMLKRDHLETMVNGTKPGKLIASETDINAYLGSLTFDKPKGQGLEVTPITLRIGLKNGAAKLEFLGVIHFGSAFDKQFYLGYEGVPQIVGGKFAFKPTGGWLGKLPVHPKILASTPWFGNQVGTLLKNLEGDKSLLDKLSMINLASNTVELVKAP